MDLSLLQYKPKTSIQQIVTPPKWKWTWMHRTNQMMLRACNLLQVPPSFLIPSSIVSSNSTLASHTDHTIKPKKPGSIIPLIRQASKDDKDSTGSTNRSKINDSFTGSNNLIITGYQPGHKESKLLLDLIVYDIPAKWSNYELLSNLNNWGKVISASTRV
ncbi:hypothetical protein RCL_jg27066.t1 [Rhizophagus clarus]|uniref:Uncharacterized protein n=1 Tax=Rhizophagus clarus TaxID=94130 RepID=A0A8H3R3A4_9GLOM|nr:hypothetical protein RCL_jg27066.t1 [Rhizophagus clarus]